MPAPSGRIGCEARRWVRAARMRRERHDARDAPPLHASGGAGPGASRALSLGPRSTTGREDGLKMTSEVPVSEAGALKDASTEALRRRKRPYSCAGHASTIAAAPTRRSSRRAREPCSRLSAAKKRLQAACTSAERCIDAALAQSSAGSAAAAGARGGAVTCAGPCALQRRCRKQAR
jgi:hypothetical protein